MSQLRWYAGWAAALLVLTALPLIVLATRGATSATTDPLRPKPTPTGAVRPAPTPPVEPSASGSAAPALDAVPLCANVWQPGRMLPTDYRGCQRDGAVTKPHTDECLISYQGRWWARPGQSVHRVKDTPRTDGLYAAALSGC